MPPVEISVVVPVFNAESYLIETLDALDKQSFRSFEVILVDDGSTDESPRLLDDYCAGHERFHVLHIPNGGVYNARLAGIRQARGRYVAFCDSDDLPLPDMLEKLYAQAENTGADITVCGFVREEMETGKVLSREMRAFECRGYDFPELWDVLPVVNTAVWNKLFRAELLEHVIRLEKPTRVAEDLVFSVSLYPFVRRIAFVPEALYRYRVRSGSAVSHVSAAEIDQIRENMLLTRDYALSLQDSAPMREMLDSVAFIHFGWALVIRQVKSGESSREVVSSARQWLRREFPGYGRAGKDIVWNLCHSMLQSRVLIGRWIFCAHLMGPFLVFYDIITQKLKHEIKW